MKKYAYCDTPEAVVAIRQRVAEAGGASQVVWSPDTHRYLIGYTGASLVAPLSRYNFPLGHYILLLHDNCGWVHLYNTLASADAGWSEELVDLLTDVAVEHGWVIRGKSPTVVALTPLGREFAIDLLQIEVD